LNLQSLEIKAFEDKVRARWQEAKARIDEIEAHSRGKWAQAEIDAINGFKTKRGEIERKSQELQRSPEAKAAQLKAEIEAEVAKLKRRWTNSAARSRAGGQLRVNKTAGLNI
jgi:hypothetical protein